MAPSEILPFAEALPQAEKEMRPRRVDAEAIRVFQQELAGPIMEAVKIRGNHGHSVTREDKMMAWGPIWDRVYILEEAGHSNVFELLNKIVKVMGGDQKKVSHARINQIRTDGLFPCGNEVSFEGGYKICSLVHCFPLPDPTRPPVPVPEDPKQAPP